MFKILLFFGSILFCLSKVSILIGSVYEEKILKEEWTCSDCGEENPFWYTLCGGCGKFYW